MTLFGTTRVYVVVDLTECLKCYWPRGTSIADKNSNYTERATVYNPGKSALPEALSITPSMSFPVRSQGIAPSMKRRASSGTAATCASSGGSVYQWPEHPERQ